MNFTIKQFNKKMIYQLPSAYFCGVRLHSLNQQVCKTSVKFKWINKNPFKSIYFAVLAMSAELSTAMFVLKYTAESNVDFSTLILGVNAQFLKKATGKIYFICDEGDGVQNYVKQAITTKEGVPFTLKSIGVNSEGEEVAKFEFQWSIKTK